MDPGAFTMIRPALITSPNFWMTSSLREKITAVCPGAGMIYVDAQLERFIDGVGAADASTEKVFRPTRDIRGLLRQSAQSEFGLRRDRKSDHAGDIDGFLATAMAA